MSKANPAPMNLPPRFATRGAATPSVTSIDQPPEQTSEASGQRIAVTVRMDRDTYVRLKTMGARIGKKNQDILLDCLRDKLDAYERANT